MWQVSSLPMEGSLRAVEQALHLLLREGPAPTGRKAKRVEFPRDALAAEALRPPGQNQRRGLADAPVFVRIALPRL